MTANGARYATVAFVGFAAVVAIFLWTRPTVIRGPAAATMLLELVRAKGVEPTSVTCDDATPVTARGAIVGCTIDMLGEGVRFQLQYHPDGRIAGAPITSRAVPAEHAP